MKKLITVSLLIILICVLSIGFVSCNMAREFEPWLNEINIDDVVEISIKYDNGSVSPTIERHINYTSDREEIERLIKAWRNVTLTRKLNLGPRPGKGIMSYTVYMEDGTTYSFETNHDSYGDWYTINNVDYLMSDSPYIRENKVTRVETYIPDPILGGEKYVITDFVAWLDEIKAEDIVKIINSHYGATLEEDRYTTDKEEIARLLNEWRNVTITNPVYFNPDGEDITHIFIMADGTRYELYMRADLDGYTYVEIDGVGMCYAFDIPLISEDKITSKT